MPEYSQAAINWHSMTSKNIYKIYTSMFIINVVGAIVLLYSVVKFQRFEYQRVVFLHCFCRCNSIIWVRVGSVGSAVLVRSAWTPQNTTKHGKKPPYTSYMSIEVKLLQLSRNSTEHRRTVQNTAKHYKTHMKLSKGTAKHHHIQMNRCQLPK